MGEALVRMIAMKAIRSLCAAVGGAALLLGCLGHSVRAQDVGGAHRPLIAIIGDNDGTETTDFIIPYGVLTASGVADVVDVSVHAGPLILMPGLTIVAKETIDSFDAKHPGGADYVIVPAMHHADNPVLIAWLQKQAALHATTVGICDGAWVVGKAGLLENRSATGHWYSRSSLAKQYPHTQWINDRRYVEDDHLITTTGVTASLPVSLALVERIAGRERATALAHELGVSSWSAAHHSADFHLTARHVATAASNWLQFWRWESVAVPIDTNVDEISLSFTVDALGRTYRTSAYTVGRGATIRSKRGLTIVPDRQPDAAPATEIPVPVDVGPGQALDRILDTITRRYGLNTARFVALLVEYPWP